MKKIEAIIRPEKLEVLRLELEKAHTYEVPEVVALQVVQAAPNYLNWLENELNLPGV